MDTTRNSKVQMTDGFRLTFFLFSAQGHNIIKNRLLIFSDDVCQLCVCFSSFQGRLKKTTQQSLKNGKHENGERSVAHNYTYTYQ